MKVIKILGKGAFGKTYLVQDKKTKRKYVVKEMKKSKKIEEIITQERKALEKIKSKCRKYLTCIHSFKIEKNKVFIIMDYIPGTIELGQYLEKSFNKLDIFSKFVIMKKLLEGIKVLHGLGVVHKDIKPENILFNPDTLDIHYIDFGFACLKKDIDCLEDRVGTPGFESPELLNMDIDLNWEMIKKSDIWALGITFLDVCFFRVGILDDNLSSKSLDNFVLNLTDRKIKRIFTKDFRSQEDKFLANIIKKMLKVNSKQRPSTLEMLKFINNQVGTLIKITKPPSIKISKKCESILIEMMAKKCTKKK